MARVKRAVASSTARGVGEGLSETRVAPCRQLNEQVMRRASVPRPKTPRASSSLDSAHQRLPPQRHQLQPLIATASMPPASKSTTRSFPICDHGAAAFTAVVHAAKVA